MSERLHLLGADGADLEIISACLQDAVTCRADMAFSPRERRFALVLNRFRWEGPEEEQQRVRTGLHFDDVRRVRLKDLPSGHDPLELLAIQARQDDGGALILFHFAGGGAILLEAECLSCEMHDLTAPWAARLTPHHNGARDKG
jgi:hypothetical protein